MDLPEVWTVSFTVYWWLGRVLPYVSLVFPDPGIPWSHRIEEVLDLCQSRSRSSFRSQAPVPSRMLRLALLWCWMYGCFESQSKILQRSLSWRPSCKSEICFCIRSIGFCRSSKIFFSCWCLLFSSKDICLWNSASNRETHWSTSFCCSAILVRSARYPSANWVKLFAIRSVDRLQSTIFSSRFVI